MDVSLDEISAIPAFKKLSTTSLIQLAQASTSLVFSSGYKFYQQGDDPTGLFTLQPGRVKLYRCSKDKVQILSMLQKEETFGAESFPTQAPSPCTAEAISPGSAFYLSQEAINRLLAECPDLLMILLELISGRLRQFTSLVHSLAFRDVSARLAEALLQQVEGNRIQRVLSQQDLAALVGTAREVISRTFKKFEQEGIIKITPGEIIILDVQKLRAIASEEMK